MKQFEKAVLRALVTVAAVAASCGLAADEVIRAETRRVGVHSATIHFQAGHQTASFRLAEPQGDILLYRISAPAGLTLRGFAQLPSITVPLLISTSPVGPNIGCSASGDRVVCTAGEEWCPMPEGAWHFRLVKTGGPPGDVTLTFKIGEPPGQAP
jgi:hypothetical protein